MDTTTNHITQCDCSLTVAWSLSSFVNVEQQCHGCWQLETVFLVTLCFIHECFMSQMTGIFSMVFAAQFFPVRTRFLSLCLCLFLSPTPFSLPFSCLSSLSPSPPHPHSHSFGKCFIHDLPSVPDTDWVVLGIPEGWMKRINPDPGNSESGACLTSRPCLRKSGSLGSDMLPPTSPIPQCFLLYSLKIKSIQ